MADALDYLVDVVAAIKSDEKLRESFIRLLSVGSSSQQVNVTALRAELVKVRAPEEVEKFLRLLSNDKIAHQVLTMLQLQ